MRQHGAEGTSITISARDVVVSLACTFVQSSLDVYKARYGTTALHVLDVDLHVGRYKVIGLLRSPHRVPVPSHNYL